MSFLSHSIVISSEVKINAILHINIFLPSDQRKCYFEMGVLIDKIETESDKERVVEIEVPIAASEFEFEDLYGRFKEKPDYLRLIFNEKSLIDQNDKFRLENKEVIFGKASIEANKITLKIDTDIKHYFRFRLRGIEKTRLSLEKKTTSPMIDPFERYINISGFHINNIRNTSDQANGKENKLNIDGVNVFFICDITTTLVDSGVTKKSFRLLEDDTWKEYMSDSVQDETDNSLEKVVYQFRKDGERGVNNFKLFVKTSHISSKNMYQYLSIIVCVAILAGLLSNFLSKRLGF